MRDTDNRVLRWLIYHFAWWIVRRNLRRNRTKLIAAGVIGAVVVGGAVAARAASSE
jgi:transposase